MHTMCSWPVLLLQVKRSTMGGKDGVLSFLYIFLIEIGTECFSVSDTRMVFGT